MKFAEHLSAHITPEWRKQYIQYERMKEMLYAAVDSIPETYLGAENQHEEFVRKFDEEFFSFCQKELDKINSFFAEKLAEAVRRYNDLKAELDTVIPGAENQDGSPNLQPVNHGGHKKQPRKVSKKISDLKLAFSEFYLNLVLLQNYQTLNFTGFRKILKKHDKLIHTNAGNEWRQKHVDQARFYTCKDVDKLIEKTENIFTNVLEDGNRPRAMKRLRVPPLNAQQSLWTTFRVGFYSGIFILVFATALFQLFSNRAQINFKLMCLLFRGPFFVWLFLFLLGINLYGWRTNGVNHVLIFELDPRDHISEQHLFEVSFLFAVIWGFCLLGFSFAPHFDIDSNIFPLINVIFYILFLINPTKTFRPTARFWLLRVLYRVLCSPFFTVRFADFWMADQLTSLSMMFADTIFFFFYYVNAYFLNADSKGSYIPHGLVFILCKAVFMATPAWFRFTQCLRRYHDDHYRSIFPHAVNASKYSTSFFVIFFSTLTQLTATVADDPTSSTFFYFWMFSLLISSIFTYTWDVIMDWGLMNVDSKENWLLRSELVYQKPYYYFAILEDFIGRTLWAFTISLNKVGNVDPDWLSLVAAIFEIFRRFVWNFLRLENEHLNNCGEFRAVRDISISPINPNNAQSYPNGTNGGLFKKHKNRKANKLNKHKNRQQQDLSLNETRSGEVALLMDSKNTSNKNFDKLI